MNLKTATPSKLSPFEVTLDANLLHEPTPGESGSDGSFDPKHVAMVRGSTPHFSGETHGLLRSRLRAAALAIFVCSGLFLLADLFAGGQISPKLDAAALESRVFLFWVHAAQVAAVGIASA